MNEQIKKLEKQILDLTRQMKEMEMKIQKMGESSLQTGKREVINQEVQFLRKCYRADGTLITQINT